MAVDAVKLKIKIQEEKKFHLIKFSLKLYLLSSEKW
jgi:hypothetical protein